MNIASLTGLASSVHYSDSQLATIGTDFGDVHPLPGRGAMPSAIQEQV